MTVSLLLFKTGSCCVAPAALKSQSSCLSLATSGFNKDESCSQLSWKRLWQNKCFRLGITWSWESHPSHSQHYISWVPVHTCWRLSLTQAFLQWPSVTPKPKPASQFPPYLKTHNMSSKDLHMSPQNWFLSLLVVCIAGFFFLKYPAPSEKLKLISFTPIFLIICLASMSPTKLD